MEKIYPSWENFKAKYPNEKLQQDRFEDLVRALFCVRYNIEHGIFQCYNHAGNETETIKIGSEVIGFNAKFFDKKIDAEKIKHSISTAHKWNPNQNRVLIYTNLTFNRSSQVNAKPKIQENIEKFATSLGITVEWITDKMILDDVIKNDWIYEFFFRIDSPLEKIIKAEETNTTSIFAAIRTSLYKGIYIDYSKEKEEIMNAICSMNDVIIYGEGGCGKTALLKSIWETYKYTLPICIRKAQDVKNISIDKMFEGGIDVFLDAYKDVKNKVMIIDSSEKIQDIEDTSTLESLIITLKNAGWTFVFTVRNVYLECLLDDLHYKYNINPVHIKIEPISKEYLKDLLTNNGFELPSNVFFQDRLCTLFYLDLFLKYYKEVDINCTYSKFSEIIWKEKISGKMTLGGKDIKRTRLFVNFIEERIEKDDFYLNDNLFDAEITQLLINDEILGRNTNGLFITHDIYEEWGLNRVIDNKWNVRSSTENFFKSLTCSFLIRRAFRQWLTDRIETNVEEVKKLLYKSLDVQIEQLWRDEILIGIMESSYASVFFTEIKNDLLKDDAKLLNRILFLLRLACKRLDRVIEYLGIECPMYAPLGSGWSAVIHMLYESQDCKKYIKHRNTILKEWTLYNKKGETTREAGLLALDTLASLETDHTLVYNDSYIKDLCDIIVYSSLEIKFEISELIKKIIENKWNSHRDPYYNLCHFILSKPQDAILLIKSVPDDIFPLMDLFWRFKKEEPNNKYFAEVSLSNEISLGLNHAELSQLYGPACAFKTPLLILLENEFDKALEYIVGFTNGIIDFILKNNFRGEKLEEIKIFLRTGNYVVQYGNQSLWELYRGSIRDSYPEIVTSMHMALERVLLKIAEDEKNDTVLFGAIDYILSNSKSVSLTAVVSSIVLAYPERLYTYAIDLFKTIELFKWDSTRLQDENMFPFFYRMETLQDKFAAKERLDTLEQAFRKHSLEALCVEYQYIRKIEIEQHNKLVNDIHSVLDEHYKTISKFSDEEKKINKILLYRMDKRTHDSKISTTDNNQIQIEFNPRLPEELKKYSEDAHDFFTGWMMYQNLMTWCIKKYKGEETVIYKELDENPLIAIQYAKDILKDIENNKPLEPNVYHIPLSVASTMLLFYENLLEEKDLFFCKKTIEEKVQESLMSDFWIQSLEGKEACINALFVLIRLFPTDRLCYVNILARILCDHRDIPPKRICDYAIDGLRKYNNDNLLRTIIAHYIIIASDSLERITSYQILDNSLKHRVEKLDFSSAEVLFELFPLGTDNDLYKSYIQELLPRFAQTIEQENNLFRSFSKHSVKRYLNKAIAYHALHLKVEDVETFFSPFLKHFDCSENSLEFIRQFLTAEYYIRSKSVFWEIWRVLYRAVVERGIGWNDDVLQAYLLADYLSPTETYDFDDTNLWLYDNAVNDFADSPATIYAIAQNLTTFASNYVEKGIEWLYNIVSAHPNISLRNRKKNVISNMEIFVGCVVRKNRAGIRGNKKIKDKLITILTFMVERESVQAFMLRDMIA